MFLIFICLPLRGCYKTALYIIGSSYEQTLTSIYSLDKYQIRRILYHMTSVLHIYKHFLHVYKKESNSGNNGLQELTINNRLE